MNKRIAALKKEALKNKGKGDKLRGDYTNNSKYVKDLHTVIDGLRHQASTVFKTQSAIDSKLQNTCNAHGLAYFGASNNLIHHADSTFSAIHRLGKDLGGVQEEEDLDLEFFEF